MPRRHTAAVDARGFTLIEALAAVVILGILVAVALPSFIDSIRKGRRADAFKALSAVQQAQERWRAGKPSYAGGDLLSTAPPDGLGVAASTDYYTITLSDANATGYTATATAISGKSQANDAGCQVLAVRVAGGNLSRGSGTSTPDWTDARRCWAR